MLGEYRLLSCGNLALFNSSGASRLSLTGQPKRGGGRKEKTKHFCVCLRCGDPQSHRRYEEEYTYTMCPFYIIKDYYYRLLTMLFIIHHIFWGFYFFPFFLRIVRSLCSTFYTFCAVVCSPSYIITWIHMRDVCQQTTVNILRCGFCYTNLSVFKRENPAPKFQKQKPKSSFYYFTKSWWKKEMRSKVRLQKKNSHSSKKKDRKAAKWTTEEDPELRKGGRWGPPPKKKKKKFLFFFNFVSENKTKQKSNKKKRKKKKRKTENNNNLGVQ